MGVKSKFQYTYKGASDTRHSKAPSRSRTLGEAGWVEEGLLAQSTEICSSRKFWKITSFSSVRRSCFNKATIDRLADDHVRCRHHQSRWSIFWSILGELTLKVKVQKVLIIFIVVFLYLILIKVLSLHFNLELASFFSGFTEARSVAFCLSEESRGLGCR